MDYRDWGYGERPPYERRPAASWAGDDERLSADDLPNSTFWGQGSHPGRAFGGSDLTSTDFDDAYWTPPSSAAARPVSPAPAPSSAIPAQRRGGRHRDDSDAEDWPGSNPVSSGPLSSGPLSSGPLSNRPVSSGPVSSGALSNRPLSNRPMSAGPVSSRPISAGPVSDTPVSSAASWRASAPVRSWDRPTGTAGWQPGPETDRWERSDDTGEWVRAGHTGDWRSPHGRSWSEPSRDDDDWRRDRDPYPRDWRDDTSAGEWRRGAHTGQFDRITDTGQFDRIADTGSWNVRGDAPDWTRSERPRRRSGQVEPEDSWQAPGDTFWSGTRLAGDDPRWVETPASAPRSPAVAYPTPPRTTRPAPPSARQVYRPPVRRGRGNRFDEELLDFDPGGHVASLLYTALWYAVPVLFFALWTFTLDNTPPPSGCVTDVTGGGCQSERAQAIASIMGGAPQFGAAFLASLVVAIVLRWASGTWRAASVGLAAAVVGGGLSTVLFSALSGQPLG